MALIDIDKFICSYLCILEKRKEHTKGIEGLKISSRYQLIIDLLKQQGIIYKDGSLIKIGSKKCEGKLKEMLDEKVLANSCESCKDSQRIAREEGIEKACEYLKFDMINNLAFEGRFHRLEIIDGIIDKFKQAMEKGE